ncbi:MAG TPA: VWA domain-containing protein, partial [Leucothrix sp.]|nr:VWA domain-containing protein [Leucothrix sp.]
MKKLISILFVLLFIPQLVVAQDNPQAMIVFDASGSMWGQIDGKAKITIAKKALNKVVTDWDENVHLGLIAYGHRKKGDCNDIQILSPIGKVNRSGMISKVKKIKPKGKTPISRSIKKAAEALKYTEEKATVILISDGKETCDADPCGTAKSLESDGIDFVAHVIGFDVDKQTDAQLKCIADATGGEYFSAKNASALNDAMSQIIEKVKEPEPPVVVVHKYNLEITATEEGSEKWIDAVHIIYTDTGSEDRVKVKTCDSYKKKPCERNIPVGQYVVESSYNDFNQKTAFEITEGEKTKLNIVMGQTGIAVLSAVEEVGGKQVHAEHRIYADTGSDEESEEVRSCDSYMDKPSERKIPVGQYIIKSSYNDFKQTTPLEITAGKKTKLTIIMGQTGIAVLSAVEEEGGKQIHAVHRIYIDTGSDEESEEVRSCDSYKDKPCERRIPVGQYIIKSTYNDFKQTTPLEITAGKKTKLNIIMGQTGKAVISAVEEEGGKWVNASHAIYINTGSDEQGERIDVCNSSKKEACKVKIPVCQYIV